MEVKQGNKSITINNEKRKAIIEFDFGEYILYVFQGTISEFDIFIKYKKDNLRMRTPKHIHWVVDVLIKMQWQKRLTIKFLREIKKIWNTCIPLSNNDYTTLKSLIENALSKIEIAKFKTLDKYGEYSTDFLFVLMYLLSVQEKTNRADAYMFGSIIDELLNDNYDIFKIVSTAGYSGRS
ncbi:MAG: hypothetical protein ACI4MS_00920 [Candidatus Coproplasma sp.]